MGCCKAKGKAEFNISGIVPLKGKEVLVILSNRDYSEGILNVPLDNCATWASLYNLLIDIVNSYVFNS